jgi:prophage regulatory protein
MRLLATDDSLPGFGVYLTPRGKLVYAVVFQREGESVTEVFGSVTKISFKKARKAAAKVMPDTSPVPKTSPVAQASSKNPSVRRRRRTNAGGKTNLAPELATPPRAAEEMPVAPRKLLTFTELKLKHSIPYSRRQIDRLEAAGKFPKRVAIGEHRVAWVASEIAAYLEILIAKRSSGIGAIGSASESGYPRGPRRRISPDDKS